MKRGWSHWSALLACAVVAPALGLLPAAGHLRPRPAPRTYPWTATPPPQPPPRLLPGAPAPPLSLATLAGRFVAGAHPRPAVFNVLDGRSGFSLSLWTRPQAWDGLLTGLAAGTVNSDHIFIPGQNCSSPGPCDEPQPSVHQLAEQMELRMLQLGIGTAARARARKRLHFGLQPPTGWVATLLAEWSTTRDQMLIRGAGRPVGLARLDAQYDWLGWSEDPSGVLHNRSLELIWVPDPCAGYPAGNHTGVVAVGPDSPSCDAWQKVRVALLVNASALVLVAAGPLYALSCNGAECSSAAQLPLTMITASAGAWLQRVIGQGKARVEFVTGKADGTDFAIAADGTLAESWGGSGLGAGEVDGNPGDKSAKLYPDMGFLRWAAEGLQYLDQLRSRIEQLPSAVQVFSKQHLRPASGNCYGASPYGCGPWAKIPQAELQIHSTQRLFLDMQISCAGLTDKSCAQWDHIVTLRSCCTEGSFCDAQSGPELGRWMTSFGRSEGHWLTDITPIAGLLQTSPAGQCNLTAFSAPWAGNQGAIPWLVTLSLRRQLGPSVVSSVLTPWIGTTTESGGIAAVFRWVFFNQSYSQRFPAFSFNLSQTPGRVQLAAYITGHGNDQHGCGEFCATTHVFTLNGYKFVKNNSLPATNQQLGCTEYVSSGVVPNEYGTWLYGRDGWCNGHPVTLWQTDVTKAALVGPNGLSYIGLWNGSAPDPGPASAWQQAEPVIMASIYVIVTY